MSRSDRISRRRGVAAIEFALTAPFLLLIMIGSADLVVWMRTWLQIQKSAAGVAQVISQYKATYTSDFTGVFYPIAQAGMGSGLLACSKGGMVVTGVDNSTGTPKVGWQWKSGSCVSSSYTTTSGSTLKPSLPGSYAPPSGLSVIIVELATSQSTFLLSAGLMGTSGPSAIAAYNVVMPRAGGLPTLTTGTRPSS